MEGLIGGLKGTAKVMSPDMVVKLGSHDTLKNFRDKVEVGNRTVVYKLISIKLWFLQKRGNNCFLENSRKRSVG